MQNCLKIVFSGSNEQYAEIVRLKQNLFEQVQEKDSLMKTVSVLKNDLKREENKNIDREIALEKKIKQLNNIIFKRGQSAQTGVDKQKAVMTGILHSLNVDTIVIPDSDETLMLCEESRSKMLLKEQDPFEHAYWKSGILVPAIGPYSFLPQPVIVEVPKELPKVVKDGTKATVSLVVARGGLNNTRLVSTQSQAQDTVIVNLKEQIKSLKGNVEDNIVKIDMDEIETLNIELEHRVTKLVTENEL
ncbi:hypothetical protein Tco_0242651 [Tanacetum coccineum]